MTGMNPLRVLMVAVVVICACASAIAHPSGPVVLLVNPKSGIKTLADFVAWGKRRTKPIAYGSSGIKSDGHRLAESFTQKVGINAVHVPYRAHAQGILDLLGGHIDFMSINAIAAIAQIRSGLLTAVAIAAKQRVPEYPDVPTFIESG